MIISDLSHLETVETKEIQGSSRFFSPGPNFQVGIIANPQLALGLAGPGGLAVGANFSNNRIVQRA